MLHFLGETWIFGWVVAMIMALRWHHVLVTGSQSDSEGVPEQGPTERTWPVLDPKTTASRFVEAQL